MTIRRTTARALLLVLLVSSIPASRASADHIGEGPRHAGTPASVSGILAVMPLESQGTTSRHVPVTEKG